jgi:dual specificity tyrosine-phosphorylation-regulated kinase 2/3/4
LTDFDGENSFPATPAKPYKSIADFTPDSRRKVSSDLSRMHLRKSTSETLDKIVGPSAAHKTVRAPADETGRKNNNLQPLRLPPLNLGPINTTATRGATLPRPSQELERRNESASMNTPEPKRTAKTPSTPMTASKATFFRRQDEENAKQGPVRSSTSHFALRELIQLDDNTMKFFDDTDLDFLNGGVQIPGAAQRNAITPFASGSLPKTTEDFSKLRGSASGELSDGFSSSRYDSSQLPNARAQPPPLARTATTNSFKSADLPTATNSPSADSSHSDSKKEVNGTTSRRKLSLGWRRSSSKNANHADHKASASHDAFVLDDKAKAQRRISEMPPPKLPASATWVGDAPALPRPSLDSIHRKSTAASLTTLSTVTSHTDADSITSSTPKTNGQRIAQPGAAPNPNRSSSWGNIMPGSRSNAKPASSSLKPRHGLTASTISAIVKDKDDLAADDEMRRLSQKRRDVDTAARETEDLKRRAVARTPMTPEQVLQDRNYSLNIFERGEIMDFQKEGIFFTGTKTARKVIGSLAPTPQVSSDDKNSKAGNYGYDDERGDYNIVLGDHLAYRYEVVDVLGKGSFGQVVRCVDHKAGGIVAVKIIRNKKRFHQQALVEVGILSRLRDWVSSCNASDTRRRRALTSIRRIPRERTQHCPSHRLSISDHISASLRLVSASTCTS